MTTNPLSHVTEADLASSRKLRGLFTDRIYVQQHGDGMHLRINFGEIVGGDAEYHTAIVVTSSDALEFAELIHRMGLMAVEHSKSLLGEDNG